jgi:hypothetical protein
VITGKHHRLVTNGGCRKLYPGDPAMVVFLVKLGTDPNYLNRLSSQIIDMTSVDVMLYVLTIPGKSPH